MDTLNTFRIRLGEASDLDRLVSVEQAAWGAGAASRDLLQRRIEAKGNYTIVALNLAEEIVAFTNTVLVDSTILTQPPAKWSSHPPECRLSGDGPAALFGVNLASKGGQQNLGAARAAMEGTLSLVVHLGCTALVAGGRMPGYRKWSKVLSADDYLHTYVQGKNILYVAPDGTVHFGGSLKRLLRRRSRIEPMKAWRALGLRASTATRQEIRHVDPHLRFYAQCRGAGRNIRFVKALPEYFPDPASCNFGAWYRWDNPFRAAKLPGAQGEPTLNTASST